MDSTRGFKDEYDSRERPASLTTTRRRHLVASKLSAPQLRAGIVDRPTLLDPLISPACAPIVLVSAPAGYGKTTLLALWRERDGRPFAWVTVDSADNDAVVLVASISSALSSIVPLDPGISDVLNVPEPPLDEVILPQLMENCRRSTPGFVLVLDDLHLVTDRRSLASIRYIAERLPPGCRLALATRTDPTLPLASWRAHGRLAEWRAAELALSASEARAILAGAGVELSEDLVARLVERTEGWPAGIYLAALSLRDRAHPEDFIARFTGVTRHVADFLSEDVLARQSQEVVDFLLQTSVLEELSPSLCDALTGRSDADLQLRELERGNLFVVPLDEEPLAYRYHHLFAQYLRAELAHKNPKLIPELHSRATRWYLEHGLIARAVAHAHAAGDRANAAELVAAHWLPTVERGQVETVRSWIDGFSDCEIEQHAPLAIATAWVAALAGDGDRAARFAEAARRGSWDGAMPDGTASLESALAIMSSAFGIGGVSGMKRAAQRAVELESHPTGWRALSLMLLGVAQALQGEDSNAREALLEAVELSRGETSTGTTSLAYLALVSLHQGDEECAMRYAERAHRVVERPGMRNYMPSVCTYSIVAHMLIRRGDVAGAAAARDRVRLLLPRLTQAYWWQMIETRILLLPVLMGLGCREEAAAYLNEAESLLAQHRDAGKLPEWLVDAARDLRHSDRRARSSAKLSAAERRILRLLASDLTLREIGSELFLSMNTVRTHKRSIYRKLGVSSRLEALRAAQPEMHGEHDDSPG